MDTRKIFEETGKLGNEIGKLQTQLEQVNLKCFKMMEMCPHEIVFKYIDNHPRKAMIDGSYFCPACGKSTGLVIKGQTIPFEKSRVIALTNLSLIGSSDLYHTIRNEVYGNMDFYYNPNISTEELSSKMELILEDKQSKYQSPRNYLKRELKPNKN